MNGNLYLNCSGKLYLFRCPHLSKTSRLVLLLVEIDLKFIKPANRQSEALILWTVLSRASLCSLFSSHCPYLGKSRLFFFLPLSSSSTVFIVSMKTIITLRLGFNVLTWWLKVPKSLTPWLVNLVAWCCWNEQQAHNRRVWELSKNLNSSF